MSDKKIDPECVKGIKEVNNLYDSYKQSKGANLNLLEGKKQQLEVVHKAKGLLQSCKPTLSSKGKAANSMIR